MRGVFTPPFSPSSSPLLSSPLSLRPLASFFPCLDESTAPTQGLGLDLGLGHPWWAASVITQLGLPPHTPFIPPAHTAPGHYLDGFFEPSAGHHLAGQDHFNVAAAAAAAAAQPHRTEAIIAAAPFELPLAQCLVEPISTCGPEVPHLPLLRVEPASEPSSSPLDMVEVKCEQDDDDDGDDDDFVRDFLDSAGLAVGYDCTSPASSRPSTPAQPPLPSWPPLAGRLVTLATSAPPSPAFLLPPKKKQKTSHVPRQHDHLNEEVDNNNHTSCPDCWFYLYTTMPEKKKPIWVVFYCTHEHDMTTARLTFTSTDSHASGAGEAVVADLAADLDLSWAAKVNVPHPDTGRDTAMVQHKWCFVCPDDTFNSRVFSARLVEPTATAVVTTVLGGLSVISTTSQRRTRRAGVERVCGSESERRLVTNCARHPPKRRHFLNGKGKGQRPRKPKDTAYLLDELSRAVQVRPSHDA